MTPRLRPRPALGSALGLVLTLAVAGCADAGPTVTTVDGAATFDLPDGWVDRTEELRDTAEQATSTAAGGALTYVFGAAPEGSDLATTEHALMVNRVDPAWSLDEARATVAGVAGSTGVTTHDVDGEQAFLSGVTLAGSEDAVMEDLVVNHGGSTYTVTLLGDATPDEASSQVTTLLDSWAWTD